MADDVSGSVSNEPVIAPLPTPISVEPRTAPPAEAAEIARQAEEAKLPKEAAKPVEKEAASEAKKPLSTREALRAAREKVEAPAVAEKAKAEPVAEKASPIKDDSQPRGDDGKFTAKAAEPASKADAQAVKADEPVAKVDATKKADSVVKAEPVTAKVDAPKPAALPSHTAEAPPARFSAAAKEKWAEAPDEVRAEVTRAVTELTKGFEKHRIAAARDADLVEFHDMAAKGNTTVKEALSKYVNMENVLRADPIKGLELIAQNAGLSLKDVAAKILNQAPDAAASQQDATIRELNAKIARLEQGLHGITAEREQTRTQSTTETVTKFAADHPRFEELSEDIAFFLKTRTKDLAEAYSLAERLNPAPAAQAAAPEPAPASSAPAVTKPTLVSPAPAANAAGTKSIAGAPTAGSDPARKQTSSSIKEALKRARQAVA